MLAMNNPEKPLFERLTRRELEILDLLAEGLTSKEIAERLTLAVSSVRWYVQQIYGKLGVNGKRQAINRACELGLIKSAPERLILPTESNQPGSNPMQPLPTGTVTFLFTDIVGSTTLWERDPVAMEAAIEIHNAILRQAIQTNGGVVFKTVGDEFQVAFSTAPQALRAALQAQRNLAAALWNELGPMEVRMGIHTGVAYLDDSGDEYAVSHTKNRGHRVMEAANGGQILISQESADLCQRSLPESVVLKDLGEHHIRNWKDPEHFYQVSAPDLVGSFPPLRTQAEPKHNLPVQLTSFIGRREGNRPHRGSL